MCQLPTFKCPTCDGVPVCVEYTMSELDPLVQYLVCAKCRVLWVAAWDSSCGDNYDSRVATQDELDHVLPDGIDGVCDVTEELERQRNRLTPGGAVGRVGGKGGETMIQKFVDKFMSGKKTLEAQFKAKRPDSYIDIVRAVVSVIGGEDDDDYGNSPDPERIHQIDDGDYHGTLVFVIGATGYQPSTYWYVCVSYGSCSGCDTLQAIHQWAMKSRTKRPRTT